VGITHPLDPARRLGVVWLRDQALGTSAATYQHFEHGGRRLGHLLDPRTGFPAQGIASASAVAPNAATADALATAFYVGGINLARTMCQDHPGLGAILLPDRPGDRLIVIGLPAGSFMLADDLGVMA
jgi:thiamine biosynthesis lipoprotein